MPGFQHADSLRTVPEAFTVPPADSYVTRVIRETLLAFWTDPERFDPDRLIAGREPRDRHAYLPFSEEPRACFGDRFALLEMAIQVRAVDRALRLDWIEGQTAELEPQINPRSQHALSFQPAIR